MAIASSGKFRLTTNMPRPRRQLAPEGTDLDEILRHLIFTAGLNPLFAVRRKARLNCRSVFSLRFAPFNVWVAAPNATRLSRGMLAALLTLISAPAGRSVCNSHRCSASKASMPTLPGHRVVPRRHIPVRRPKRFRLSVRDGHAQRFDSACPRLGSICKPFGAGLPPTRLCAVAYAPPPALQ